MLGISRSISTECLEGPLSIDILGTRWGQVLEQGTLTTCREPSAGCALAKAMHRGRAGGDWGRGMAGGWLGMAGAGGWGSP